VTRYPHRGVVVTELSEHDITEIFEARLVLESAGVRAGGGWG
jgi:DNA-binding GntR family transcriptional regulator